MGHEDESVTKAQLLSELAEMGTRLQDLRSQVRKCRALINGASDAIFLADGEWKLIDANRKAAELSGYKRAELLGLHFSTLHPGADLDGIMRELEGRGGQNRDYLYLQRKDGGKVPVDLTGSVVTFDGRRMVQAIVRDMSRRKRMLDGLHDSLRAKDVLIREIHHRAKNSLMVVLSLLRLQSGKVDDDHQRNLFKEAQNRVKALTLIHDRLSHAEGLAGLKPAEYIQTLVTELYRTYRVSQTNVKLVLDIADISLDVNTMIPCALIINELVSNSLKHAFAEGSEGEILVSLKKDAGCVYSLAVGDNGKGLPEDTDHRSAGSLGMQIVTSLAVQLGGSIELDRAGGTAFRIVFRDRQE